MSADRERRELAHVLIGYLCCVGCLVLTLALATGVI